MMRAMGRDFSTEALSVDFHPLYVAILKCYILSKLVIDSIINLVLDAIPKLLLCG